MMEEIKSSPKVEVISDEETGTLVKKSNKGKEEAIAGEEEPLIPEKSFLERVSDLLTTLKDVEGFGDNSGLKAFEKVIETIDKKTGVQRDNLEDGLRAIFKKFYLENRKYLLDGKMEFLSKDGQVIKFGSSGKAHIPLSDIYRDLASTNPEMIDSVDAGIYFVMQHVCPDEDLDAICLICKDFEPEQSATPQNFLGFIGNIVGRVSAKIGNSGRDLETEDGSIDPNAVGNVVQELIGDNEIKNSMNNMMGSITGEDFDINAVIKGLFNMNAGK